MSRLVLAAAFGYILAVLGHCRAASRGVVLPNRDEVMNSQIVAR
jgi:hypothetical protein